MCSTEIYKVILLQGDIWVCGAFPAHRAFISRGMEVMIGYHVDGVGGGEAGSVFSADDFSYIDEI